MNENPAYFIILINKLYRYTQTYLDFALEKFNLTSGMYSYILILENHEGISQNAISKKLNVDKAMSARTIKRLIELEYIVKQVDEVDSRAYKLFLTDKAKIIIPDIRREVLGWLNILSNGIPGEEMDQATELLNSALTNAKKYKSTMEEGER